MINSPDIELLIFHSKKNKDKKSRNFFCRSLRTAGTFPHDEMGKESLKIVY
jgi:hypothetical protein